MKNLGSINNLSDTPLPETCSRNPGMLLNRNSHCENITHKAHEQVDRRLLRYSQHALVCLFMLLSFWTLGIAANEDISLNKGEVLFKNYCSGCHALQYAQPASRISLPEEEAIRWFGRAPPDLSLIVRIRGLNWLRTYLTSFYPDKNKPFGSNNTLFPDVNMPNVLASLSKAESQSVVNEIVTYLDHIAEPERAFRYRLGAIVVSFLAILTILWALFFWLEKQASRNQ